MKIILEFTQDELDKAKSAIFASEMYACLFQSANQIRTCLKHNPENALEVLAELRSDFLAITDKIDNA